jgi:hypothetical protein
MLKRLGSFVLVLAVGVHFWLAGWPGPLEIVTAVVLFGYIAYKLRSESPPERDVAGGTSWSSHDGGGGYGGGGDGGGGGD